ncbi:respiratory chain complex I subunit 1 family protein [Metallosphaera tengchongensis]|uniref:Respiratory chain complex I subunit 1 family protein n=1 Tax=Metallosphaera tengchongensis TaxID=1532350 RepID=A0A6N0NUZ8_9CREN|nr:respiratory chain complex I subunit 1 family protein [Metallosphaera tengchongensis]QKR00626.1 respiratory chain complex I subunit 1 family protein [Metallosphaera tengchongensis]
MILATVVETLAQVLGTILLSPLYAGIMERLKATVEGRRGPSIFQPYYDITKLFKKEFLLPGNAGVLFIYGPYLVFSIYVIISFVIPVVYPRPVFLTPTVDFLGGALLFSLAAFIKVYEAMESSSNLVTLGVSRVLSFSYLGEATLFSVFIAVALITGTNNPYVTMEFVQSLGNYLLLPHISATVAFFMLWLFETGRLPLESSGLAEMGIIDDSLIYEYSGSRLSLLKWGSYMKSYLLGSVFLNVFMLPWGLLTGPLGAVLDLGIMFAKWIFLIVLTVVIETSLAKFRLFKVQDFLTVALVLSIISLILTVIDNG